MKEETVVLENPGKYNISPVYFAAEVNRICLDVLYERVRQSKISFHSLYSTLRLPLHKPNHSLSRCGRQNGERYFCSAPELQAVVVIELN